MEQVPEIWFVHLGIKIRELNRVALTIFGLDIYWYGILIGLGTLAGIAYVCREAERTGQDKELYLDLAIYVTIFGIIGARIYFIAFSWEDYKDHLLDVLHTRGGGLAIYGCIIAGIITIILFAKRRKVSVLKICDTVAPGLILGQIIGRFGNFFNREAFGGYTDNLFAMRYLADTVSSGYKTPEILEHMVTVNGADYIQVHPTFLYESLWNLGLFALILFMKKRGFIKFEGQITALYFLGYGIGRTWIEGLRTDQLRIGQAVAVSQLLSVLLAAASICFMVVQLRRQKHQTKEGL